MDEGGRAITVRALATVAPAAFVVPEAAMGFVAVAALIPFIIVV